MGTAISAMRSEIRRGNDESKKRSLEDLQVLQEMVDSRLDKYQAELNTRFLNAEATSKTTVPGVRALRWERKATCNISEKPMDEVHSAIDAFFSIKQGDVGGSVVQGFKNLVSGALKAFLGESSAGQHEEEKFFIFMQHNTVVRIDVKLFRWNFTGEGVYKTEQSCLGYIFCLSVVDPVKLKTAEFVYLISEYAGDGEADVENYTNAMAKLYNAARKMKLSERAAELDDH